MSEQDVWQCHLAFAKLELLELQAGRRGLTQCPGIEAVAGAIAIAKRDAETDAQMRAGMRQLKKDGGL